MIVFGTEPSELSVQRKWTVVRGAERTNEIDICKQRDRSRRRGILLSCPDEINWLPTALWLYTCCHCNNTNTIDRPSCLFVYALFRLQFHMLLVHVIYQEQQVTKQLKCGAHVKHGACYIAIFNSNASLQLRNLKRSELKMFCVLTEKRKYS